MFPALAWVAITITPLPLHPAPAGDARAAVARALPLLAKGAEGHVEKRSCFACHNQAFPVMALAAARDRGFDVAGGSFTTQAEHIARFLTDNRDKFLKGQGTGGQVDTAGYAMFTLELAGHKPDETTAAVVSYLLQFPGDRDHWRTGSNRPPSEASSFVPTYLALRALRVWATPEQKERAAKRTETARGWLLKSKAKDTEDRVFRLFGLAEVKADAKELSAAAWELLRTQRADGGWSQKDGMASDPYATGTALVALHRAGGLPTDHPAYRQGVAFLLTSQEADGSWLVRSRSSPFQPYYETGFPHAKNQFIAVTASGWATTALVLACGK